MTLAALSQASDQIPESLLVFLHGRGEIGGNIDQQVRKYGPWTNILYNPKDTYGPDTITEIRRYHVLGLHLSAEDWNGEALSEAVDAGCCGSPCTASARAAQSPQSPPSARQAAPRDIRMQRSACCGQCRSTCSIARKTGWFPSKAAQGCISGSAATCRACASSIRPSWPMKRPHMIAGRSSMDRRGCTAGCRRRHAIPQSGRILTCRAQRKTTQVDGNRRSGV